MITRTIWLLAATVLWILVPACDAPDDEESDEESIDDTENDSDPADSDTQDSAGESSDTASDTMPDTSPDTESDTESDTLTDTDPTCADFVPCKKNADTDGEYICPSGAAADQQCVRMEICGDDDTVLCMSRDEACQLACPRMGCWLDDANPADRGCEVE